MDQSEVCLWSYQAPPLTGMEWYVMSHYQLFHSVTDGRWKPIQLIVSLWSGCATVICLMT